jgi:hypothetical protein
MDRTSKSLPSWADQMKALEKVVDNLMATWRPNPTEAERQDMNRLALSMLSSGYLCHVYTDANRPAFMPLWNIAFNQGGPVPEYAYFQTEVDPQGVYRISGYRGTSRFVEITQQNHRFMSPDRVTRPDPNGPRPVSHDLDEDLKVGEDGYFSVVLSAERPAGYAGDWWQMQPTTVALMMRKCNCDWNHEVDARVAIDRLDEDGADMAPEEIARRFSEMATWIEGTIGFDMALVRYYREHHGLNTLIRSKWIDISGGLPKQAYYDGIHEIDDDEALIIETELPKKVRFWQALVADDRFCTIDWVNRQSSLNDTQARLDSDGKFRAVISRRDPGVPNWLDKADYPWGIIQMRWNRASDFPDPVIKKVPFAEIRKHLPADTPVVSPEERRRLLRIRREGALLRQLW